MYRAIILIITAFCLFAGSAFAAVPQFINYQGLLQDTTGVPVADGPHLIKFIIWDDLVATGAGNEKWSSGFQTINTTDGLFEYQLGSIVPLPAGLFSNNTILYLGVTEGVNPEMLPRTKLVSVSYAFKAAYADDADFLDGLNSTDFAAGVHNHAAADITPQGSGSTLDADLLDGNDATAFAGAAHTHSNMEIIDEPGIAQGISKQTSISITSTTSYTDVVLVSITIPASGYIVVEAISWAFFFGTTGSNFLTYQIDETAGGNDNFSYYAAVGSASGHVSSTNNDYATAVSRRTYFKAAGTYTFRLEAKKWGAGSGVFHNPSITATYFSTSYGTVSTSALVSEAGEFENATPITVGESPTGEDHSQGEQYYVVDLRELELKAARAEAEAEKAKRELLEARLGVGQPSPLNRTSGGLQGDQ